MKKKKKRSSAYRRARRALGWIARLLFRVRVRGLENLPEGGFLLCCNHIDYPDAVAVGAAIPRDVHFLAKKELFRVPLLGGIMRLLGAIPVKRDAADVDAIRDVVARVTAGETVAIFPQGHRRKGLNPATTEVKHGIGMMAYLARVPVVPVCIRIKKERYGLFRRTYILVGDPILYPFSEEGARREQYLAATKTYFDATCALGGYLPPALPKGGKPCQ